MQRLDHGREDPSRRRLGPAVGGNGLGEGWRETSGFSGSWILCTSRNVAMMMYRYKGGEGTCVSNLFVCREGISWEAQVADDDVGVIILHRSLVNKVLTEHGKGIRHAC